MPALEQVKDIIRAWWHIMMALLAKIVDNVNLKASTIFEKRLILDAWLSPGCASAD